MTHLLFGVVVTGVACVGGLLGTAVTRGLGHFENASSDHDARTLPWRIIVRLCDDSLDPLECGS